MIDLYYFATPNGNKISVMLEECHLEYTIHTINILKGDQFEPSFLEISPNNRIPAIVDHNSHLSDAPFPLFESGAILIYLAEKTKLFLSFDPKERMTTIQWLMWQMGGLGPMLGQANHFISFASQDVPYAKKRYHDEAIRLYRVLDRRLEQSEYVATSAFSIADMACYPWIDRNDVHNVDISQFKHLQAWYERISARPCVKRAYEKSHQIAQQSQNES